MGLRRTCSNNLKLKIPSNGNVNLMNSSKMDIGSSLKDTLLVAKEQCRITYGVFESAKLLEIQPDSVMLCILPDNDFSDVTLHIHYTLLEAFCWENDIRILKVDSEEKLAKVLGDSTTDINDNDTQTGRVPRTTNDFNCILVEYPKDGSTESDEDVLEYFKMTEEEFPRPVIELPV